MTLDELMAGITPVAEYKGYVTADDMVLAVDISGGTATPNEYVVARVGLAGLDIQLNPITQDKTYMGVGQSTQKTGTQKTYALSGDRYIGDAFQDFCFGRDITYGKGNDVVIKYVEVCILNGKGEQGEVSVIVNSAGGGNASENAAVSIDLKKIGAIPTEYTYTPAA